MTIETTQSSYSYWQYAQFLPQCPDPAFRLPGPASMTPVKRIHLQDLNDCYIKREDINPAGSHKERAACFQLSCARQNHSPGVVIPSSGNAALAVSLYSRKADLPCFAFMAEDAIPSKIQAVAATGAHLILSPKPVNFARYAARMFGLPNLKPSESAEAITGFMTLGFEILHQFHVELPDAIFLFTTSGATLLGLSKALQSRCSATQKRPALHAVQSGKSQYLAKIFDHRSIQANSHTAAGIGGLSHSALAPQLETLIRTSNGSAWSISDDEIATWTRHLESVGIFTSPEGIAATAAVSRWRQSGGKGTALIILTGKPHIIPSPPISINAIYPSNYLDVRNYIQGVLNHE